MTLPLKVRFFSCHSLEIISSFRALVSRYEAIRFAPPPQELLEGRGEVLAWWHHNKSSFPHLYRLARKYLCILPAEAQEERNLSKVELIYNDLRQSMKEDTLNALVSLNINRSFWSINDHS